jgi:parallel beta-helix repeat protein
VDDNNNILLSIQDAIDSAEENDTIIIHRGIYYGNIIINKSINLIGENVNNTIINGDNDIFNILIVADYVNISDLTIRNGKIGIYISGINKSCYNFINNIFFYNLTNGIFLDSNSSHNIISNNIFSDGIEGIRVYNSSNNILLGNNIDNLTSFGISLWAESNSNLISDNNISYCKTGISLAGWSNFNKITKNNLTNNYEKGIEFIFSLNNLISLNLLDGYKHGIYLKNSNKNNISQNTIINMQNYGISSDNCVDNYINDNAFIDCRSDQQQEFGNFLKNYPVYELILFLFLILLIFYILRYQKFKNKDK